jgi:hypothetical protein
MNPQRRTRAATAGEQRGALRLALVRVRPLCPTTGGYPCHG